MALSIVVVTWNSAEELENLLASIEHHLGMEHELVVVDNASIDSSVAVANTWRGPKRVISLDENYGFGAAANRGVREARNEAVVLLNPDTLLVDDSLLELAELAVTEGALFGPELLAEDGARQPSASPVPASWEVGLDALVPARAMPHRLRLRLEPWRARTDCRVGWLTGACIAAPRHLLLQLGPFDEDLHLYGEDLALGLRASRARVPIVFAPTVARVVHLGERSARKRFADRGARMKLTNRRRIVRRELGPLSERYDSFAQAVFHVLRYIAKAALRRNRSREGQWLHAALSPTNGAGPARRSLRPARIAAGLRRDDVRRFSRETLLLLVTIGAFNASNYVFHVVVSRMLGPSEYGGLAALLAVLIVLSVPLAVVQTALAQKTAALRARSREDEVIEVAAGAAKTLLPLACATGLLLAVSAPALAAFLHIGLTSTILLAPYVALSLVASVPLGVLQGQERFAALAAVMLAGVAVRLALGIGLVAAGFGMSGAVLATALAPGIGLVLGLRLLRIARSGWVNARRTFAHLRGDFLAALLGLTSFWLLAEVDLALARHFLKGDESGYYSSAGVISRALLFLPAAISIVAFPRFVAARERGEGHTRWLRLSLGAVAALVCLALPVLMFASTPIMTFTYGQEFAPAAAVLPKLSVAMALLALAGLLVYFHIAMGSRAYLLVFIAIAIETVLVAIFHGTAEEIARLVVFVAGGLTLVMYASAASIVRYRPPLEQRNPDDAELRGLAAPASVQLSVVLPCHNAARALHEVLEAVLRELRDLGAYEVIVVSDGSTDRTVEVARYFAPAGVRVIDYPLRRGKGHALRAGLTEAQGAYVAFLDADGDIDPAAIGHFLSLMKLYEPDIVLGSKRHPLSEVKYPRARRLLSWTYHKLTRLLFRVSVRDTQTGMKMIRRDVLAAVLPRLLEKRYAFDLEFLVVARSLGFKRVFEAPIRIEYKFASQVNPGAALRIGIDTLAIFYRHFVLNTYRQAGSPAPPPQLAEATALPPPGEASGAVAPVVART